MDKQNSETYVALGFISLVFERDWRAATDSLSHAIDLHPNDAVNANFYGDLLYTIGNFQQAEIYEKRAAELDPLSAANQHELALVYGLLGRLPDAIALERIAIQLNPDFQNANSALARMLLESGEYRELDKLMEEQGAAMGERFSLWMESRRQIIAGNLESARNAAAQLLQIAGEQGQSKVGAAMLFALLKEDDIASSLVEKAYAEGDPILVSPLYFFLPEDWPGLPMLQQALDKPDLVELFNLRRENISAGTGRVLPRS
jgi:tetratricopeptide (TPR) repeat protein